MFQTIPNKDKLICLKETEITEDTSQTKPTITTNNMQLAHHYLRLHTISEISCKLDKITEDTWHATHNYQNTYNGHATHVWNLTEDTTYFSTQTTFFTCQN